VATIGDIKAGLTHGKTEADKALAQLSGVTAQVDKAIVVLQALMAGTSQPAVMQAIGKLNAAKQKFAEGAGAIQSAIADTEKYNSVL
jgi:alpha-D-ribose 1-methylphosphonate 5-triphosphate synthase subunit PhnH